MNFPSSSNPPNLLIVFYDFGDAVFYVFAP